MNFEYYRPDLVDLSAIQSRDNVSNLREAFDLAEKHLSVPRLLEPEGERFDCECFSWCFLFFV